MSFAPIKRLKAADQIATTIRDAILGGRYVPGEALPSERDLAVQFEVNRGTVREALKRLDTLGLVQTRHGGKTRVRDFLVSAGIQLLPHLIAPGGQIDPKLMMDLLRLRTVLLEFTARLAAENHDEKKLGALRAVLEELEQSDDPAETQRLDWDFFLGLVEMGNNGVLALLANVMGDVYRVNQSIFASLYDPGTFVTHEHHQVVDAIEAGDADTAATAMRRYGERVMGSAP